MTLADAAESFLFHCQFEKNLSPRTLKAYQIDLQQFTDFIAASGTSSSPQQTLPVSCAPVMLRK
jgi:integrase/recombinase XerD